MASSTHFEMRSCGTPDGVYGRYVVVDVVHWEACKTRMQFIEDELGRVEKIAQGKAMEVPSAVSTTTDLLASDGWVRLKHYPDRAETAKRFCLVHRDGTIEYSNDGLTMQRVDGDEFGVAMVFVGKCK